MQKYVGIVPFYLNKNTLFILSDASLVYFYLILCLKIFFCFFDVLFLP